MSDIMDRITKARGTQTNFLKCLLHGMSGSGKSTICGTAPKPILFGYTELQGVVSFKRVASDEDIVRIAGVGDLRDLLTWMKSGEIDEQAGTVNGYATLCLDSLTEMQRLIMDQYIDRQSQDRPNPDERITISQWGEIIDRTIAMVRAFRDLPMHIVMTTLSAEIVMGEGDGSRRLVRPQLSGKTLPNDLAQFFNIVGYAFKRLRDGAVDYRVLLEGNSDYLVKSMPGLAYQEVPDLSYMVERGINGSEPRDPEARMSLRPGEPIEESKTPEVEKTSGRKARGKKQER